MIRLLFIPICVFIFSSCSNSSREVDPLFYQISEVDSVRCMNEILDNIVQEGIDNQRVLEELLASVPPMTTCFPRAFFTIHVSNNAKVHCNMGKDSFSIEENIIEYFTFNRNLTPKETSAAAMDANSPHFEFPFFSRFSLEEIERKIKETKEEVEEIKKVDGADPEIIKYYASKVEEWKVRKHTLEILGIDELPEIAFHTKIQVEYRTITPKLKEVQYEVASAFYQLRNYICLLYFHETYLSLYDREKRNGRKLDLEKLKAIENLQPIAFYIVDRRKPSAAWEEEPVIQEKL